MLTPSAACFALLKRYEQGPDGDFAARAYRCPAGHFTIGWGHRVRPSERLKPPLTEAQAEALLRQDVQRLAEWLQTALKGVPLTPSMGDALLSFIFNVGYSAFVGSMLFAQVRAGNYGKAAEEFLRWNRARNPRTGKKEPLAGLTRRRQAERALFLRDGVPS